MNKKERGAMATRMVLLKAAEKAVCDAEDAEENAVRAADAAEESAEAARLVVKLIKAADWCDARVRKAAEKEARK